MFIVIKIDISTSHYQFIYDSNDIKKAMNFYSMTSISFDKYDFEQTGVLSRSWGSSIVALIDLNKVNDLWYVNNIKGKYRIYKIKQILE